MCNYSDKFIYISGGESLGNYDTIVDKVVRYNIDTEVWEDVVNLNVGRNIHSSCTLNDTIYVVGGVNGSKFISTMEKLDIKRAQSRWQIIEVRI